MMMRPTTLTMAGLIARLATQQLAEAIPCRPERSESTTARNISASSQILDFQAGG